MSSNPRTFPTRWRNTLLADAAEHFASDVTQHVMAVLHENGLYRHIRFRAGDHGFSWFDLVTWPGVLTVHGSHGSFSFSREADMFGFFRASRSVNVDYWAEKLPNGRDSVKEYSEDKTVRRLVSEYLQYGRDLPGIEARYAEDLAKWEATPARQRYPFLIKGPREPVKPRAVASLRRQVADAKRYGDLCHEDGARRLLAEWEDARVVSDTWEWDLRDWNYHYLWCCHAIRWGIRQYDAARSTKDGGDHG